MVTKSCTTWDDRKPNKIMVISLAHPPDIITSVEGLDQITATPMTNTNTSSCVASYGRPGQEET
jgi:hypothetical protein